MLCFDPIHFFITQILNFRLHSAVDPKHLGIGRPQPIVVAVTYLKDYKMDLNHLHLIEEHFLKTLKSLLEILDNQSHNSIFKPNIFSF